MNDDSKIIKLKNYQKILGLFLEQPVLSKPQIAELLKISLPTVNANITALLKEGFIVKSRFLSSEGGRPAAGYSLDASARVAFAVEIKFNQVRCARVDLLGQMHDLEEHELPLNDNQHYLENFCRIVKDYLSRQSVPQDRVLGLGVCVQALVDLAGTKMIYSKILPLSTLSAADFSREFNCPVRLCHDVECAALSDLWASRSLENGFYVSIGEHLGGALIHHHSIEHGRHGYAGALEHLKIGSEGRRCYCGREDCLETYCSISALLAPEEKLKDFFKRLREGQKLGEEHARWSTYLKHLAAGLYPVYLILERDLILGGDLAPYLNETDLACIEEEMLKLASFPIARGFVKRAQVLKDAAIKGAGIFFIKEEQLKLQSLL